MSLSSPRESTASLALAASLLRGALLAGVCTAMLWRVLAPGTFPYGHDTVAHDLPIHLWAWNQTAQTGRLPLWIPPLQNGLPTLGSFAWCPFSPTNAAMGISLLGGFRLQWWFVLLLAGLGTAAWGRAAGLDVAGRWTAAVAFALGGHLVTLLSPGHLQKAQAIAWLPWALAGVEWGLVASQAATTFKPMARARLGGFAAGAAIGIQLLASHTQIAYITIFLVGWRGLWVCLNRLRTQWRAPRPLASTAANCAMAAALGAFLFGGAQWIQGLETARLSNRAGGVAYSEAVLTSYPPRELLEYAFPRFLGDSVRGGWNSYWGEWGERLVTDYAGAGTLLLAAVGMALGRRRGRLRGWLLLTAAGSLLLALGHHTPLYRWAYDWLPGFNRFRSPGTQMVATAFCLAAAAGLGMTALREVFHIGGLHRLRWMLGIGVPALVLPWFGTVLLRMAEPGASVPSDSASIFQSVQQHKTILLSSVGETFLWAGVFACALLAVLWIESRGRRPETPLRRWIHRLAPVLWMIPVGILALDLTVRLQPFLSPEPAGPYLRWLLDSPVDSAIVRDSRRPLRFIERGNELTLRPMLRGIDVPMGYHPVTWRWMLDAMEELGLESPGLRGVWAVGYVKTPGPEPPDNATTWTLLLHTPQGMLWRDEAPMPFARFPGALVRRGAETILAKIANQAPANPLRPAVLEPEETERIYAWLSNPTDTPSWAKELPIPAAGESRKSLSANGTDAPRGEEAPRPWAVLLRSGSDEYVLRAGARGSAWMVLAMPPAPGWSAWKGTGREQPLPLFRADRCCALTAWPGGEDFLVLRYQPWAVRLGVFFTLLGALLMALAAGYALARCPRRRTSRAET